MRLCYIHEPWIYILVFSSEWIFRQGYFHGHCIDTLIRAEDRNEFFNFLAELTITRKINYRLISRFASFPETFI